MTCAEVITTFLADYLDGKLSAATLEDFQHHLDVCPSCVAYLATYRETIRVAAAAEGRLAAPEDVPEELVQAILATGRAR